MKIEKKKFGDILCEMNIITSQQLEEALKYQKEKKSYKKLGAILVELGYISEQQINEVLEFQLGIPYIDLNLTKIPKEMASKIPASIARKHEVLPVSVDKGKLFIAMEDPLNIITIDDVSIASGMEVRPMFSKRESILKAIEELYGNTGAERAIADFQKENDLEKAAADVANDTASLNDVNSAPIVRLLNSILEQAIKRGASDIHVEALENEVRIRLRIDGSLTTVLNVPATAHSSIITRIKIMGNLNIAERRVPQDGRFQINILNHHIDIRISTIPTVFGEKAVLRLLDRSSFIKPKEELGFTKKNLQKFDELLQNPHGIILVTGPTGSGKSTTLYTMLRDLNKITRNIITIEDPVEYMLDGVNQIHVNFKAGMDFATGLRSILRQDPDVVMIGEIRDSETVEIAIRAAITGHLVLSTIHTNDAVSTIARLVDMGIAPYMLSVSLVGIISQRLVRTICPVCKSPYVPNAVEFKSLGMDHDENIKFYRGEGCANCSGTGYKGRTAVHEVLMIDKNVREMIHNNATADEIIEYSLKNGMSLIKDECLELLKAGRTTIEEVTAVAIMKN